MRIKELAAIKRLENKKLYLEAKKKRDGKRDQAETEQSNYVYIRDGKARVVNFEFINIHRFGVSSNFLMPDRIVNII